MMYFIGVSTAQSSIMKVFPRWAEALGLDAALTGMDFPLDSTPSRYREAVAFIKADPLSLGALVTTHKVNLLKAARDLFGDLDPLAVRLGEVSCISKRKTRLRGHAKDPISVGCALDAIVEAGYWRRSGSEMLVLGAGGAAMALTLCLHDRAKAGQDVPRKLTITGLNDRALEDIRAVHARNGFAIAVEYAVTPEPTAADRLVERLPPGSMVVNAPGSARTGPVRRSPTLRASLATGSPGTSTIEATLNSCARHARLRQAADSRSKTAGCISSTAGRV